MRNLNHYQLRQIGWSFGVLWTLVSTIGLSIGVIIGIGGGGESFLGLMAFSIGSGIVVGVMQWLVLRSKIDQAGRWILVTAAGWVLGWIVIEMFGFGDSPSRWGEFTTVATIGILPGSLMGLGQWFVLRQHVTRAGWWALGSILSAFGASVIGTQGAYTVSPEQIDPMVGEIIFMFIFAVIFGILHGIATGTLLIWLFRQPAH